MKRVVILLLTIGSVFIIDSLNSYNNTKQQLNSGITEKPCKKACFHFFENHNVKYLTLNTKKRVRRYYL